MDGSLSIVIPTYNRHLALRKCLEALLLQNRRIPVLILDNCSKTPAASVVSDCERLATTIDIRVVRNAVNIGLFGNILKCMEYVESDYVWIVGDDDRLESGAFAAALEAIAGNPDLLAYNFSSGLFAHEADKIVRGNTIFADIPSFSNLLYLSATIFNLKKLRSSIPYGYQYAYSTGPHLAVLFASVKACEAVGYFKSLVVRPQVEEGQARWSVLNHWHCIPFLAEVAPEGPGRRDLLKRINASVSIPVFLVNHLVVAIVWKSSRRAFEHYRQCVWRHYRITKGPLFAMSATLLGWMVVYFKFISISVCGLYLKHKGMKGIKERCRIFEERLDVL